MLVLTRRPGEAIIIRCGATRITVKVSRVKGERVYLGIEAPRECAVDRPERLEQKDR